MKFHTAILALLAVHSSNAFLPSQPSRSTTVRRSMATEVDISVPYDAAARLAYDQWRNKYSKGDFDEARYQVFKNNYEAITVANVVAKKKAREEELESPALMTLNEFGDCTEEEYKAAMSGGEASATTSAVPTTTGDVLGKAMDAAQSQSEASNALKDAADALAEEEEVGFWVDRRSTALAKKLGLNSVEELEAALDSMEGIAEDGGEVEQDNLAREARVRAAYLDWCKQYKKEPQEDRFKVFSENFLVMEKYAKETAIQAAQEAAKQEAKRAAERRAIEEEAARQAREQAKKEEEKLKKIRSDTSVTASSSVKPVQIEIKLPGISQPPAPKSAPKKAPAFSFLNPSPKAAPKKAPARVSAPKPAAAKKKADAPAFSFFSAPAPKKAPAPQAVAPSPAPKAAPKKAAEPAFSFFSAPAPKKAPAPKAVTPSPAPKKDAPPAFSLFNAPAPKKAPAPAPKPAPAPEKAPAFSFFSAPAPKKAPAPSPSPAAKSPAKSSPSFSIFGSAPAPAPKKEAPKFPERGGTFNIFGTPSPAPARKEEPKIPNRAGTFNLFGGSPSPAPKQEPKIPNRAGTLNLFGGAPKPAPKKEPKIPNRSGTLSLFDSKPKPKPAPTEAPAAKPAFSFFGGGGAPAKKAPAPKTAPAGVPTLSKWKQNPDGSITGRITGSKNFRPNTEITTSPVKRGAQAGQTVKTSSGSQYFLS
eukprot:scaffold806_cov142-Amphora_coffeaeformis.AAC.2